MMSFQKKPKTEASLQRASLYGWDAGVAPTCGSERMAKAQWEACGKNDSISEKKGNSELGAKIAIYSHEWARW